MRPPSDASASHQASIDIAAPPEVVYDLVSDITRMGEWSPEATGGKWLRGGTGNVGDWFEGVSETTERPPWHRECEVAAAERGRDFTFVVGGVEANCTWWSYEMEPTDEGTRLTEYWWFVNKTPGFAAATDEQVAGRIAFTETMLHDTVAALKTASEASS